MLFYPAFTCALTCERGVLFYNRSAAFQIGVYRPPAVGLWLGVGCHAPTISPDGMPCGRFFKLGFIGVFEVSIVGTGLPDGP